MKREEMMNTIKAFAAKYSKNRKAQAAAVAVVVAAIVGVVSFNANREVPYLPDIVEPEMEATIEGEETPLGNTPGTTSKTKKTTKTSKKKVSLKTAATKSETKNLGTKTTTTSNTKKVDANTTVKTDVTKAVTTTEKYVKGSKTKTVTTKTVTTTKTTTTVTASASASTGSSSARPAASSSTATAGEVKLSSIAQKMPSNVISAYEALGFKVIVDPSAAASGHFVAKTRTTTIRSTDTTIYHEIGHFIAFAAGNVDQTSNFESIYQSEKGSFSGTNKIYAQQRASEFFAESVREYTVGDKAGLKAKCPKTYAAIESAIAKITDSQVALLKRAYGSVWS